MRQQYSPEVLSPENATQEALKRMPTSAYSDDALHFVFKSSNGRDELHYESRDIFINSGVRSACAAYWRAVAWYCVYFFGLWPHVWYFHSWASVRRSRPHHVIVIFFISHSKSLRYRSDLSYAMPHQQISNIWHSPLQYIRDFTCEHISDCLAEYRRHCSMLPSFWALLASHHSFLWR